MLNAAVKPVLIAGVKLRSWEATSPSANWQMRQVVLWRPWRMPGLFPESHPAILALTGTGQQFRLR